MGWTYDSSKLRPKQEVGVIWNAKGIVRSFGLVQVRLFHKPKNIAYSFLSELNERLSYFHESPFDIFTTESILPGDPKANRPEMDEAKKIEVRGLFERGKFKVILREKVPPNANTLPGRFVLVIKFTEDGLINYKNRFVIGDHREKLKNL